MKKILLIIGLMLAATCSFAADRVLNTDIVVVGSGATGLSAAVKSAQNGAKVVLLEKNPYLGGGSNFAEGMFAVGSEQQRKAGYRISVEEAFHHMMELNRYKVNAALNKQFFENSAASIAWLTEQGVSFDPVQISHTEPRVWHLVEDNGRFVHGGALVSTLEKRAIEAGVTILKRTPGKKLIYKNGVVSGVIAEDSKGNKVTVNAKAVLLATGGFNNSPEKIAKWTTFDPDSFKPILPINKTGDGIQMAMDIGADAKGMSLMLHTSAEGTNITPLGNLWTVSWQPTLWVNKYGERFISEEVAFSFGNAGNAIGAQRDHYAWAIFSEDDVKYFQEHGIDSGVGVIVRIGTKLTNLQNEIDFIEQNGSDGFFMAFSPEELAVKIGADPEILKATLANYNNMAAKGVDSQFFKPAEWMKPVNGKKYYALKIVAQHFTSIGGLRVTTNMEVKDKNDRVIKGLYAGGCDVGELHDMSYTLWTSGHAYGFAGYSGQAAADAMLKYAGIMK